MKHLQKIVLLLAALVLATGCIKENLEDCETPATIYFQYKADGDENVLPSYISKIDLYVFDADNRLVDIKKYGQDDLADKDKGHTFRLKTGKYKLVALANDYDRTEVINLNSQVLEQIYVQHPNYGTEKTINGHDDNYMGEKEIEIPEYDSRGYEAIVEMHSSHVEVLVEIEGLKHHPGAVVDGKPNLHLRFENSNGQFNFKNEVNDEMKEVCFPELIYNADKGIIHTNQLKLFRMDCEGRIERTCCNHVLVLTDSEGNELARENIYEYIQKHQKEADVTKEEARLPIAIEFTEMGVEIKLPGWAVVDGTPDWN